MITFNSNHQKKIYLKLIPKKEKVKFPEKDLFFIL